MKQLWWKTALLLLLLWLPIHLMGCGASAAADLYAGGGMEPQQRTAQTLSNNNFGLALLRQLRQEQAANNLFFSPVSISTALTMAFVGARGTTATQMRQTLQLQLEGNELYNAISSMLRTLNARRDKGSYELSLANRLWGDQKTTFLPAFLSVLESQFDAPLQSVDFQGNPDGARKQINAWVAEKTKGKIKELLAEGIVDADTRLVLSNAVYFKGLWANRFRKEETVEQDFFLSKDSKVKVPMMKHAPKAAYLSEGSFKLLSLDYKDNEVSMVILMPQLGTLTEFVSQLTSEKLDNWLSRAQEDKVEVVIPKFQLSQEVRLAPILQQMGMTDAFGATADFSGMNGKKDLFLKAVVHKATLEVNEDGSEATGSSAVVVNKKSASGPLTFEATRPFVFLIKDKRTGTILFLGQVTNPVAKPATKAP